MTIFLTVGPSKQYTAFISEAALPLDDPSFFTEEIDFDAMYGATATDTLLYAARHSDEGREYCWLEDDPEAECEHPVAEVVPMRIIAIRDNRQDRFVYDIRWTS